MRKTFLIPIALGLLAAGMALVLTQRTSIRTRPATVSEPRAPSGSQPHSHVYSTWDVMEFDKCATAWLIKRFVDQEAVFRFHPKGATEMEGTPFDVPGVPWSRRHLECTFEAVLKSLDTDDAALAEIGHMAHITELNRWQLDQFHEIRYHDEKVRRIMDNATSPGECFVQTGDYFDALYEQLASKAGSNPAGAPGNASSAPGTHWRQ